MENNKLKEKIRNHIKEEIAILNIRKEFDMKITKNKRIIYAVSSICAVLILGIGILVGISKPNDDTLNIGKSKNNQTENKSANIELNINILKDMMMASLDGDVKTINMEQQLPEEVKFMKNLLTPEGYELENIYAVYTRESKEKADYSILHDYVWNYKKDDFHNIKIAFSKVEPPLRDYYIQEGEEISRIDNVELQISQSKEMYIVTFVYNDIYFDIETTGVTEEQLVDLLESLIHNITNV